MKIMKIVLLILLFHLATNEIYDINTNYNEIELKDSYSTLFYHLREPSITAGKNPYFFFNFEQGNSFLLEVNVTIRDQYENKREYSISEYPDKTKWYSFEIVNPGNQTLSIEIEKFVSNNIKIIFIENSREIIIDLANLFNLDLKILEIYSKTLPLIFDANSNEYETFIIPDLDKYSYYTIIDGNAILEYCLVNGNECIYQECNGIVNFAKGKKYKIKLNLQDYYSYYYFFMFSDITIFKEIELGVTKFSSNRNRINYIIINIKNNEKMNIFLKSYNNRYYRYYTALINDYNKDNLIEDIVNIDYETRESDEIMQLTKSTYNYLVIKIKDISFNKIDGFICVVSDLHIINYKDAPQELEVEQGRNALIKIENFSSGGTGVLASSNKNIIIIDSSFIYSNASNIVFLIKDSFQSFYEDAKYV